MQLRFHKRLYSIEAIQQSADAYKEVADVRIDTADPSYVTVDFDRVDEDVAAVIRDEFANFALYRTIIERQT